MRRITSVLQGFRGAIDTILSTVFVVAVGSVGWFKDNLPNHAAAARAIDAGDAERARTAMEKVLGYTKSKLSNKKPAIAAVERKGARTSSAKAKSKKRKRHLS